MELAREVTKENLYTLVVKFYAKVLKDDVIGPIFIGVLGKDMKSDTWKEHIQILTDFWASIALGDFAYKGSPFSPHVKLESQLSIKAFDQWLKLFFETLSSIYHPQIAEQFLAKSKTIAGNFIRNLNLD